AHNIRPRRSPYVFPNRTIRCERTNQGLLFCQRCQFGFGTTKSATCTSKKVHYPAANPHRKVAVHWKLRSRHLKSLSLPSNVFAKTAGFCPPAEIPHSPKTPKLLLDELGIGKKT